VAVFRVRPVGKVPTIENVKGAVPLVTVSAGLLNGVPVVPEVTEEHVSTGVGGGAIVIPQPGAVTVFGFGVPESTTCAVKV
jgi:hypothetical protein